jgi:lysophospholipase L1-like esterase
MKYLPSRDRQVSRRNFLKTTAVASASLTISSILSSSGCSSALISSKDRASYRLTEKNSVILFQGDSITDAGRDRKRVNNANEPSALGTGFVFLAASQLLAEHFEAKPRIFNRGISGNKVFQLAERWDTDCIALKPDVVSILIGVNDYWHTFKHEYNGTVEKYEGDYRALLERTRRELPTVTLVICEPFVLRCGEVNEKWFPEFDRYRAAAKKVSTEFNAIFVPFQSLFDEAGKKAPPRYWAGDGVHPTIAGAYLMAQAWLKEVLSLKF